VRVSVISHTYVVGHNRAKLDRLAERRGIEVLLVIPERWRNRDIDHVISADAPSGTQYSTAVLPAWMVGYGSFIFYSPVKLYRLLKESRPNVVYLEEEPWSFAALELSLLCWVLRIPLVFFTWQNLDRGLPAPLRAIRRFVLRRAAAAIAGNQQAKVLLERSQFGKPVAVIPQLGIDLDDSAGVSPRAERFVIGFVGRLVPQKGIMFLLEASARISGATVLLIGRGPMKADLVRRAAELGLDGRLELCEGVAHQEVPKYLRQMSVLVLPSLTTAKWKEQFGHVLIEAMASGVPVIGTDSGAIPEVIGDAGIVVKEGSVDALASALSQLMEDQALRNTLKAKGRARVCAEYTNKVVAERLAQFLAAV
jgi:glycosyltransferase involved in cell wall biosynthesis